MATPRWRTGQVLFPDQNKPTTAAREVQDNRTLFEMQDLHTQKVMNIHRQQRREARACPPVSPYVNVSSNAFASCRSAVSKPSVNQP
jgi:hypothetical protein